MIYPKSLQLDPGQDLLKRFESLAIKEDKLGYVLSIVGNLSKAVIHCPGKEQSTTIGNHLEIIALNGTISPNRCHLHICFSDGECNVWAGHLEEGTIIYKSAEILVGFVGEPINKKGLHLINKIAEIYILPDCPWSSRAVRMLRTLQIPHNIKVIENDNDFKALNRKTNYSNFPQIFIDGEFIGGYSDLAELHASGKLRD